MPEIEPTEEQRAQAILAQNELIETINGLLREGLDYRIVLTGLGAATADFITTKLGNTAVAPWHEMQARLVRTMMN